MILLEKMRIVKKFLYGYLSLTYLVNFEIRQGIIIFLYKIINYIYQIR